MDRFFPSVQPRCCSNVAPDLSAKLLGTFAQLVPGMSSVGVVVNPANPGAVAQMTALAARRATSTIPIVFLGISDPVGSGLAASFAHPGGNATVMERSKRCTL